MVLSAGRGFHGAFRQSGLFNSKAPYESVSDLLPLVRIDRPTHPPLSQSQPLIRLSLMELGRVPRTVAVYHPHLLVVYGIRFAGRCLNIAARLPGLRILGAVKGLEPPA